MRKNVKNSSDCRGSSKNSFTPLGLAWLSSALLATLATSCNYEIGLNDSAPALEADATPTAGAAPVFTYVGSSSLTMSWGAATAIGISSSDLKYKIVRSTHLGDIDTLEKARSITSGAGLIMDWTPNVTSFGVTGLSPSTTYYIAVIVTDNAGHETLYTIRSVSTTALDTTPPSAGTNLSFSGISPTGMTLTWGAASDNVTAASELKYKIVKSTNEADIDTAAEVRAITSGSNLAMDWTPNVSSLNLTGLSQATTYYFALAVKDIDGNDTVYAPRSAATLDIIPPETPVGVSISFSKVTDNSLTIHWPEATDVGTATSNLEYKVVRATTVADIDTVAEADAVTGSALMLDWTAGITSQSFTGLTPGSLYAYTVVVRDESGNKAVYIPKARPLGKMIYRTTQTYDGNLGGVAGADLNCSLHKQDNVDTTATVKALIVDGSDRIACSAANCSGGPSSNWVLSPSIAYFNTYGQSIGIATGNKIFSLPVSNPIDRVISGIQSVWTGFDSSSAWVADSSNRCSGWVSNSSSASGAVGLLSTSGSDVVNYTLFGSSAGGCNQSRYLYCVEQVSAPNVPTGAKMYLDAAYVAGSYDTPPVSCTNTWVDLTPNGNSGTLTQFGGGCTSAWSGTGLNTDPFSLNFDSAGRVPTTLDVKPSVMPSTTWEIWVKPTRINHNLRQQILSDDDGAWDRSLLIEAFTGNISVFTGTSTVWQPTTITLNQWQHIAVTFTPTNIYLYKNGTKFSYGIAPSFGGTTANLMVGSNPAFGEKFQGGVALLAIYDRALTDKEISDHCKDYQSRFSGVACN